MGQLAVLATRVVLALVLTGSLFIQTVMVPLLAVDLNDLNADHDHLKVPLVLIAVLGVLCVEVTVVCIWRLLTMVRRGTVFSHAAFRFVDIVIAAIGVGALLMFALGVVLAPGDAVAPGIVLLVGGAGVLIAGVALVVVVMRMLLAQAVARDLEAERLQADLDGVI